MKIEEKEGPQGIWKTYSDDDDDDDDDDYNNKRKKNKNNLEGDVDEEKLRKYELEKLMYYYAIAEFDSIKTAEAVYSQVDNLEFGRSGNHLDVRFVPDEIEFTNKPKETITSLPNE